MTGRAGLVLRLCVQLAWVGLTCSSVSRARADSERFAIIIGNNQGAAHEVVLRYAETDAQRMYGVLRDLGGFEPANMVMLRGEDAETVRSTLIALNDRVRASASTPDHKTLLFVYYSGHADAESIHLAETRLAFTELTRLVRGSAATLRLFVVDACRSGMLTRVKGGRPVAPFALPTDQARLSEGFALLTASAANEDAQESDELGASFFTHAFVSGLRGAADSNADGRVLLEEAYQHAYAATLRASSQSAQGTQHPTFQYDVRGREAVVLSVLDVSQRHQARLQLPGGLSFLIMKDNESGQVVAEVPEQSSARTLSLPSGRYFVRGRARDHLLEGSVALQPGTRQVLDVSRFDRVAYTRLVRKGANEARLVHGPFGAATVRSSLPGAHLACLGVAAGYALHFRYLSLLPRLDYCRSGFDNAVVHARTNELGLGIAALHSWDVGRLSASLGVAVSTQLSDQRFKTRGSSPPRLSAAPYSALVTMLSVELGRGMFVGLDARAETYLLRLERPLRPGDHWSAAFAVRGGLLAGTVF